MHEIFVRSGLNEQETPPICEVTTALYGCRATKDLINMSVRVTIVGFGCLPCRRTKELGLLMSELWPEHTFLHQPDVLCTSLMNTNPVIHPAITLLSLSRMETEHMKFYRDGVSPSVAKLIEIVDNERIAIGKKLGYELQPDLVCSRQSGYCDPKASTYYDCYHGGEGFGEFEAPLLQVDTNPVWDHRYFQEDVAYGLVYFHDLGKVSGVETPTIDAIITLAGAIAGKNYFDLRMRSLESVGLMGLTVDEIKEKMKAQ